MSRCNGCTLCCHLLDVEALNKKAGEQCIHCKDKFGCLIHSIRPLECRAYECIWYTNKHLPDELRPDICGVLFELANNHKTAIALVDPKRPDAWKEKEPKRVIRSLVNSGRAVIVNLPVGKKFILPEGMTKLDALNDVFNILIQTRKIKNGST